MREFAKISPQFWISDRGKQIKNLGIKAQLIAFYLSTNPHACMIGIYYLPLVFISHETGVKFDDVVETLKSLIDINFCTYDEKTEYIWVSVKLPGYPAGFLRGPRLPYFAYNNQLNLLPLIISFRISRLIIFICI